jgi:hypothetical protein
MKGFAMSNEVQFQRGISLVGVMGGVIIAVGLPYVVLAYGGDLSSGAKVALIILGILTGGLIALASAVVGIAMPKAVRGAAIHLPVGCCEPEPTKPEESRE